MTPQMSNKALLVFALGLGIVVAIILMAMSAPAQVAADSEDYVLTQMELSWISASATETQARAIFYEAAITRCELEKALAQYKIAMNYEPARRAELEAKLNTVCTAIGF